MFCVLHINRWAVVVERSISTFKDWSRCSGINEGEFIADVKLLHIIAAEAEIYSSFIEARCPAVVTTKVMTGCTRAHPSLQGKLSFPKNMAVLGTFSLPNMTYNTFIYYLILASYHRTSFTLIPTALSQCEDPERHLTSTSSVIAVG